MQQDQWLVEELSCEENGESPFRTARTLIRDKSSEACWSTFSAKLGNLYCPNRDYLCEGFSAFLSGRQYKILDAYAVGIIDANKKPVELIPKSVFVTPQSATYTYFFSSQNGSGTLKVAYWLSHKKQPALITDFFIDASDDVACNLSIVVRPLVSLSQFCSSDCAKDISSVATDKKALLCTSQQACVEFHSETATRTTPLDVLQPWDCKLGFGERKRESSGYVPKPVLATSKITGELELATVKKHATLYATVFSAGQKAVVPEKSAPSANPATLEKAAQSANSASLAVLASKFSEELSAAKNLWGERQSKRLEWRFYNLAHNFDFEVNGLTGFDAGSMWFRQLWLRDAFETLYSNFDFFYCCEPAKARELILHGLSIQDSAGIIPTRVGEKGDKASNGLDSTLLCMLCGCKHYERSGDEKISAALSHALRKFLSQASSKKHAVSLDYGLLSCPANYSWTDSCEKLAVAGEELLIPRRIPAAWLGTTLEEKQNASSAKYLLVEINALWVSLLRYASKLSIPRKNELDWLSKLSQRNFYEIFPRDGFLAHIASADDPFAIYDASFSSASVMAYSLLPHMFRKADLHKAFIRVQQNLVYRNGLAFGIPVRAGKGFEESFENDAQYHGHVCWPRDTPYLFKFLNSCNRHDLAEQLLKSSLEQEFSESAIGYCPELFALDDGKEPVPVKNPAQLWSQFADPYLDFFRQKK